MTTIRGTHPNQIDPSKGYLVFYTPNLDRPQVQHPMATVSGISALQMCANSPQPQRLIFVAMSESEQPR